jgi:hypothetical protein
MPDKIIVKCPKCTEEFSIDEVLTGQIQDKLKDELSKEITEKAEVESNKKLKVLEEEIEAKDKKLSEFREQELELRKKMLAFEEDKKNFEIEMQRKLDNERNKIKEELSKEGDEKNRLKVAEKDKVIDDLKKQMEEMRRKADQGSQQSQGEVFELQFEQLLRTEFPLDEILPVGKGITGCDVIQIVRDRNNRVCGKIAWEMKNTKSWSGYWIQKLKEDQRKEKAVIAVLLSSVLPDNIKNFGFTDGVWIGKYEHAVGIATALRRNLIEVANVKLFSENKNEKMEVLYNYLASVEFKHRIEAVVEGFINMKIDLDKEKRLFQKTWALREKQIEIITNNTVGMYGELKGLMGPSLPEIKQLAIEDGDAAFAESEAGAPASGETGMRGDDIEADNQGSLL